MGIHLLLTTASDGQIAPALVVVGVGSEALKEQFFASPLEILGKHVGGKLLPGGIVFIHTAGKDASGQTGWERAHLWHRKNIVHPWVQAKLRVLHGDPAVDQILAGKSNPCVFVFCCVLTAVRSQQVPSRSFPCLAAGVICVVCVCYLCSLTQSPGDQSFC